MTTAATMDAIGWFPDPARAVAEMHRVLRRGGRAVLQMGFGRAAETSQALGGVLTILGENDVRRMAEAAGFTDVAISYRRTAGTWQVYDRILAAFGQEQMRLVRGVRPAAVLPAEARASEVPSLVGSA